MAPLKIERVLNAPSRCSGMLDVSDAGIGCAGAAGAGGGDSSDSGTVLFTGYVATEPEAVYAGTGTKGPVYRYAFSAVSDEWLLDKQSVPLGGAGLAQAAGQLLQTLTNRVDAGLFTTTGVVSGPVGWSVRAFADSELVGERRDLAASTYTAYRVLNGAVTLQPAGTVTHALSDGDGTCRWRR